MDQQPTTIGERGAVEKSQWLEHSFAEGSRESSGSLLAQNADAVAAQKALRASVPPPAAPPADDMADLGEGMQRHAHFYSLDTPEEQAQALVTYIKRNHVFLSIFWGPENPDQYASYQTQTHFPARAPDSRGCTTVCVVVPLRLCFSKPPCFQFQAGAFGRLILQIGVTFAFSLASTEFFAVNELSLPVLLVRTTPRTAAFACLCCCAPCSTATCTDAPRPPPPSSMQPLLINLMTCGLFSSMLFNAWDWRMDVFRQTAAAAEGLAPDGTKQQKEAALRKRLEEINAKVQQEIELDASEKHLLSLPRGCRLYLSVRNITLQILALILAVLFMWATTSKLFRCFFGDADPDVFTRYCCSTPQAPAGGVCTRTGCSMFNPALDTLSECQASGCGTVTSPPTPSPTPFGNGQGCGAGNLIGEPFLVTLLTLILTWCFLDIPRLAVLFSQFPEYALEASKKSLNKRHRKYSVSYDMQTAFAEHNESLGELTGSGDEDEVGPPCAAVALAILCKEFPLLWKHSFYRQWRRLPFFRTFANGLAVLCTELPCGAAYRKRYLDGRLLD